jgi:small subunit ribosomal protein S9
MTNETYIAATGRRKTAVARVRLYPGDGTITINERSVEDVFSSPLHQKQVLRPLDVTETAGKYRVQAKVTGGGITGWAGAVSHGIARALVSANEGSRKTLREHGLLTRDARVKERKKYGLKRARKAPQYTKR